MGLAETELDQPADNRFEITVVGRDAIFVVDRRLGYKLYMGLEKRLSALERRRYLASLDHDLKSMSTRDFFAKYGLQG